jgi:hypothetical protein
MTGTRKPLRPPPEPRRRPPLDTDDLIVLECSRCMTAPLVTIEVVLLVMRTNMCCCDAEPINLRP